MGQIGLSNSSRSNFKVFIFEWFWFFNKFLLACVARAHGASNIPSRIYRSFFQTFAVVELPVFGCRSRLPATIILNIVIRGVHIVVIVSCGYKVKLIKTFSRCAGKNALLCIDDLNNISGDQKLSPSLIACKARPVLLFMFNFLNSSSL